MDKFCRSVQDSKANIAVLFGKDGLSPYHLGIYKSEIALVFLSWNSPGLMDTFSLTKESIFHAESKPWKPPSVRGQWKANPYSTEIREQLVALARAGRRVERLAREYEPCAATIHDWVKQAGADDGDRDDRLTSKEMEELRRLRQERDILSKGCPLKALASGLRHWFEPNGRRLVCTKRRDVAEVFEFMTAIPLTGSRFLKVICREGKPSILSR